MLGIFVKTSTRKRASSHLLVVLQAAFLVICCLPIGWRNAGSPWFLLGCAVGSVLGLIVLYYNRPGNFAVYPEVKTGAQLITHGPYRYVRHPMYTALMIMMAGIAGYNGHWVNYLAALGITTVVVMKAYREEELLPLVFPQYAVYKAQTKRFVPYVV